LRYAACIGLTVAGKAWIVRMPATARIHGGDQLEAGGIDGPVIGARDRHGAGFERLTQAVPVLGSKLTKLI
jgi:hypothetical protein